MSSINAAGYRLRHIGGGKHRREHILIAERTLGKPLPRGAVVHHANQNRADNRPENLVICPSNAYHHLLHLRIKAKEAGVPLHWRRCYFCGRFDAPEHLVILESAYHRECRADDVTNKRRTKRPNMKQTIKLTTDQVRAIRAERAQGKTLQSIADQYGVHNSQVCRIVNSQSWKIK